jgi:hypothetical protein
MKGKAPLRESRISMGGGRLLTTRKHARKNSDRAIAPDPFQRGLMNFRPFFSGQLFFGVAVSSGSGRTPRITEDLRIIPTKSGDIKKKSFNSFFFGIMSFSV